ncbi:MAG: glycoside hydrolase [Luteitalea sp.]|nr:glycoside hydrolase [Luteitalea sp.]
MTRQHTLAVLAALGALCCLGWPVAAQTSRSVEVTSPDGKIAFAVFNQGERLSYAVSRGGQPVIETSPLVISVDGVDLGHKAAIGDVERYQVDETYPWRGGHSEATNHAAGARISLAHEESDTRYTLDVRAFDEGVAFRHVVPGEGGRVPDEATAFTFPAGSTAWYHDFENHYESMYLRKDIADVEDGEWAAPPITIKLPGETGYAALTEGALGGYSGMGLQATGNRAFAIRLGHAQPLNYPFELRYGKDEGERLAKPAEVMGPVTTPWRVVLVGPDLDTLVNADIVHNVSAPPDAALFPEGFATAWIKPGRSLWRYLDGGDNSFEGMKEFSRMAGELGFEYNLLEGFWQKWPERQLRELIAFSKQHGVGIWLWKHSRDLRTPEARKAFFELCERVGAAGVKLDFFDHEHKEVVALYEVMLREAAEHEIMVNFHGANKPTGESRTWPNELTREGIYGFERSKTPAWAVHNTTLPFTRYLAGHADYTPVVFGDRRRETSWAHQIATAAVFTSPLLVYGGHPKSLLENPAVEMIKSIPSTWDETVVLPVSEIGEIAAFARRSGKQWFLAVLNGPNARTIRVPLTILGDGSHRALLVRDRRETADAVVLDEGQFTRQDAVEIVLRPGGGFIGRFTP